jgi:nicotinamide-nucleotide amidase
MNVHILTIGDELLIGQVIDTNSARMAQHLQKIGARVTGKTTVGDSEDAILDALAHATRQAEVVLITGGLGPTKDDLTTKALATFYGVGFVFHQETWERILSLLEKYGRSPTNALREQCWMPQNATILTNKMGTAPGMWFDENGSIVVAMPGVPFEMEYLMEFEIVPRLKRRLDGKPFLYRTVLTVGEGESMIAEKLKAFEENLPTWVKLAYLPGLAQVRLRLTASDNDREEVVAAKLEAKFTEMLSLIHPDWIAGFGEDTLEIALGKLLKEKDFTLSTAESCTGGYVAHLLTSVPGSSAYFMGSIVCYSNEIKVRQLGVRETTLHHAGAVSEETVREMVAGALNRLGTDIAVATSGIAGPDGGTPEKPVGTIWLAVGNKERTLTRKLQLGKDRLRNIQYTAVIALNMVRLFAREI